MISREEVLAIAHLARLRLSEEEIELFQKDLGEMLEYVRQLQEVDTTGLAPMSHPQSLRNVLREDVVGQSLPVDEALKNAPEREGDFFKVPKVIDQ